MRLPKRLVPVPLQPILRRLRDIASETTSHQILLVRVSTPEFGVYVIQGCRSPQIYSAIGAGIIPMVKD